MPSDALARLLAILPEASLLVAPDGAIRFANPAAAALLTEGATLRPGASLADFARDEAAALAEFLRRCAGSGQLVPGMLLLTDAAGQRRAFRADGALVQPRSAEHEALLLVRLLPKEAAVNQFAALNLRIEELNREIARRREAERALQDERELLRVTLSSIGDAVIATDCEGRITFMNAVAEEQTGWLQADAAGRPLHEVFVIVNEDTRAPVESPVDRVLRENVVVGLANHTLLVRRDGTAHPIDDAGAPIRDAEGNVLGVVLVFRDVSERRTRERERAEAERRKDEFLAMLAHELRNPLAAIAANVEILHRVPAGGHERTAFAGVGEAMRRQIRHLARLVDDLLDVSRIATGKIELRVKPLELNQVVEDALAVHQPAIAAQGLALSWQPASPPPLVNGDAERLAQVIDNLLSNAVKFNRPGGSLRVATGAEAGWAWVRVADTGEGIDPQVLPSIFELFVQGDSSLARTRGGLGVGLTVAKLIAELHGGRVEASSAGRGQGAQFTVRLPAHAGAVATAPQEGALPRPVARRILVVDDNVDAAASLAMLLKLSGHDVHVANDGESALRLQAQAQADFILLDLGMPGMDGFEVARRLRQQVNGNRTRIFAVTGYGADADRARVAAAGFDGHLVKPVDIQALERLVGAEG